MSCYTPLLNEVRNESKSTVKIFKVLLVIGAFFVFFYWYSVILANKHKGSPEFVPVDRKPSEDLYVQERYHPIQKINNLSDDETTTEKTTITAATLFPAKTTTFDPTPSHCGKRIVGYYSGWNNRKLNENQFSKITHLVLSFMKIHENGTISFESEEKKSLFLEMKTQAKEVNQGLKVMFSIGGMWNSEYFSKLTSSFKSRETFINSIVSFLEEYEFDGVDIFWKWPKIHEKANYVIFLRELRQGLLNSKILSIVTPSVGFELMEGFHLNGILKFADFINVETDKMNKKGGAGQFTGATSPLFSEIGQYKEDNVDWTMRHVACTTGKPNQIQMGIPFYGRFWKGVQDPVEKGDEMWRTVESTGSNGIVFWRNIESEGWPKSSSTWHDESKTPFVWDSKNQMFLGFENMESLKEKMKYTVENNLGGMTIWTLEMDDDVDSLLEAVKSSGAICSEGDRSMVKYQCN